MMLPQSMVDEEEKLSRISENDVMELRERFLHQQTDQEQCSSSYARLTQMLSKAMAYSEFLQRRFKAIKERQQQQQQKDTVNPSTISSMSDSRGDDAKSNVSMKKKREDVHTINKRKRIDDYFAPINSNGEENQSKLISEEDFFTPRHDRVINGLSVPLNQPALITGGVLHPYQIEGLEWMKSIFLNGLNGILADEMGLGKTVQSISLICEQVAAKVQGISMVVAPLSTLPNWEAEFKRFAPDVPIMLYHGTPKERAAKACLLGKEHRVCIRGCRWVHPVVLTSYEIVMRDRKALSCLSWNIIIVDEGHRLKNLNCRLVRELKAFNSQNRLLLTGTPLQNDLSELWSLLNFLLPDIFDDLDMFQQWFDFSNLAVGEERQRLVDLENDKLILSKLHAILEPFMLRRLKVEVEKFLPFKKEIVLYAPLTHQQRIFYAAVLDRSIRSKLDSKCTPPATDKSEVNIVCRRAAAEVALLRGFTEISNSEFFTKYCLQSDSETVTEHEPSINSEKFEINVSLTNEMMLLRKVCNHPYLLEYPLMDDGEYRIDEDLVRVSGKMLLLDRLLPRLRRDGHKVLIFSQMTKMLDLLQDYCTMRCFPTLRLDGSVAFKERQEHISSFNTDPDEFLFLLSTRAGGLGLNLVAADTVIIFDSDWNPQQDLQAQARCHRIGQTRPVLVFRFVVKNTVDEKIVETAYGKRKLERMVIHKGKFKADARQVDKTVDLQDLLCKDIVKIASAYDEVLLSESELDQILDRTPA